MSAWPGVLAGLGAAAGWATASHMFARALDRDEGGLSASSANLFKNTTALVVLGAVGLGIGAVYPGDARVGWLLVSGLMGFALGDSLYFAAFSRCGVQVAAIIGNLVPPLAALLAFFVLDEALSPTALIGMGISLGGIALVVLDSGPGTRAIDPKQLRIGVGFACLNSLLQAGAILTGRMGLEGADLLPGTVLRLVGGVGGAVVLAGLAAVARGPRGVVREVSGLVRPLGRRHVIRVLWLATFIGAIVNLPLHSLAMGTLSPGVSAILFATTPLWTLPIGLRFGERYGWRTALGTAAGFGGVALVILASA